MSSPDITDAEREAVASVLATPNLSMGPQEKEFERLVADYVGVRHAIAVSSGTAGLHLCVRAAGISDGDWVIIPQMCSFMSELYRSSLILSHKQEISILIEWLRR
jgi:dTDP-4-amino-4,6-dideoxygalactose transaminase